MARPTFRSDIAESINKLVPKVRRDNQTLEPRTRDPIPAAKGRGTVAASGSDSTPVTGFLTSADGMFVIVYEYHVHQ